MKPKLLFITLGWLSLALGFLGAFLPLLPTTPFVLLAGYFFSKGSPRLHAWLLRNKLFGPLIKNWQLYGVVSLKAKWLATLTIALLFGHALFYVEMHSALKGFLLLIAFAVLGFLWSRPSRHEKD